MVSFVGNGSLFKIKKTKKHTKPTITVDNIHNTNKYTAGTQEERPFTWIFDRQSSHEALARSNVPICCELCDNVFCFPQVFFWDLEEPLEPGNYQLTSGMSSLLPAFLPQLCVTTATISVLTDKTTVMTDKQTNVTCGLSPQPWKTDKCHVWFVTTATITILTDK